MRAYYSDRGRLIQIRRLNLQARGGAGHAIIRRRRPRVAQVERIQTGTRRAGDHHTSFRWPYGLSAWLEQVLSRFGIAAPAP